MLGPGSSYRIADPGRHFSQSSATVRPVASSDLGQIGEWPALGDMVIASDEPSFVSAFLARVAGCSTMLTEPALGAKRKAPPSREECAADRMAQPLWYERGEKSYRCQSKS
jgi:hypothetical protein